MHCTVQTVMRTLDPWIYFTHSISYGSHGIITDHVASGMGKKGVYEGRGDLADLLKGLFFEIFAVEDMQEKCNSKCLSPEKTKVCAVTLFFLLLRISPCLIMIESLVCFDDVIINVPICLLPITRNRFSAFKFVLPSSLNYLHTVNVLFETTL